MRRVNQERALAILSPVAVLRLWQLASELRPDRPALRALAGRDRRGRLGRSPSPASSAAISAPACTGWRSASCWAPCRACCIGMVMGLNRWVRAALDPLVAALYPIPKIAILPLLMLVFGLGDGSKIAVVAMSVLFLTIINTTVGVMQLDRIYFDVARNFRTPWHKLFLRVILPGALPTIFAGLRISLGVSLVVLVGAEFVASAVGHRLPDLDVVADPDRREHVRRHHRDHRAGRAFDVFPARVRTASDTVAPRLEVPCMRKLLLAAALRPVSPRCLRRAGQDRRSRHPGRRAVLHRHRKGLLRRREASTCVSSASIRPPRPPRRCRPTRSRSWAAASAPRSTTPSRATGRCASPWRAPATCRATPATRWCCATTSRPRVKSAKDLKGQVIAINTPASVLHFMLGRFMETDGPDDRRRADDQHGLAEHGARHGDQGDRRRHGGRALRRAVRAEEHRLPVPARRRLHDQAAARSLGDPLQQGLDGQESRTRPRPSPWPTSRACATTTMR